MRPEPSDFSAWTTGSRRLLPRRDRLARRPAGKTSGFNWDGLDARFRQAAVFGLRPQPVIVFGTPAFISSHDGNAVVGAGQGQEAAARPGWRSSARPSPLRPRRLFWTQNPDLDGAGPEQLARSGTSRTPATSGTRRRARSSTRSCCAITRRAFDDVDPQLKITTGGMYGIPGHRSRSTRRSSSSGCTGEGRQEGDRRGRPAPVRSNVEGVKEQVKDARKGSSRGGDAARLVVGEIGWASAGKPKNYFLIKSKQGQKRLLSKTYKLLLNKRTSGTSAPPTGSPTRTTAAPRSATGARRRACSTSGASTSRPAKAYRKLSIKNTR